MCRSLFAPTNLNKIELPYKQGRGPNARHCLGPYDALLWRLSHSSCKRFAIERARGRKARTKVVPW